MSLIENYPKVVRDIDRLVSGIEGLIKVLPPKDLLLRAWWEMALMQAQEEFQTEIDIGEDKIISWRMIDYVQSVIASVKPTENKKSNVTDEEWNDLKSKVDQLFTKINNEYHIARTMKNITDNPGIDIYFEEFRVKAQLHWCNVRGKRYQIHQPVYIEEMLLPHKDMLQEIFGIPGKQFIEELNKIWYTLSYGIQDIVIDLKQFNEEVMNGISKKLNNLSSTPEASFSDLTAEVIKENSWEDRRDDIFERLWGMKLFDIQEITDFPENLLEKLSWMPGEERDFFVDGEFRGWPLRIWPVFKRPFIRLNGRYYCFDIYSLFDNLYRVMQRIILDLKPDYQEDWRIIQQEQSENLPFKHLESVLPGAKMLKQVFYLGEINQSGTDWCECDGLLIYDDHLFIIEARGGAFTYTAPSTDFPAYVTSLKNLVLKPAMQGRRFFNYLESAETVSLFDSQHNEIGELRKSDFRNITICAVTVDSFTELAAQIQHLHKIGVDVGVEPIWAISLDDLRVYADIFDNPLIFLHYVEQRMRAFQSQKIQFIDELDHLGLYLDFNNYINIERYHSNPDLIIPGEFCFDIDQFYHAQMLGDNTISPPQQDIPKYLMEIIHFLSESNKSGRTKVAAYILNIEINSREEINTIIHEELKRQANTRRPKLCSIHGNVKLTICCWTDYSSPRSESLAFDHVQKLVVMNNEECRLLIELTYSSTGDLQNVHWRWVELAGISSDKLPNLRLKAEALRQKRISVTKSERRKIGRNESCPCGSGKKYKKCCLRR